MDVAGRDSCRLQDVLVAYTILMQRRPQLAISVASEPLPLRFLKAYSGQIFPPRNLLTLTKVISSSHVMLLAVRDRQ